MLLKLEVLEAIKRGEITLQFRRWTRPTVKPGGTLIFSSHNLKSLHWFSPYYRYQLKWKLRNFWRAFKEWDYVFEGSAHTFYSSHEYVTRQTEALGVQLVEIRGFARFKNPATDHYFSPYNLYVFRKPAADHAR